MCAYDCQCMYIERNWGSGGLYQHSTYIIHIQSLSVRVSYDIFHPTSVINVAVRNHNGSHDHNRLVAVSPQFEWKALYGKPGSRRQPRFYSCTYQCGFHCTYVWLWLCAIMCSYPVQWVFGTVVEWWGDCPPIIPVIQLVPMSQPKPVPPSFQSYQSLPPKKSRAFSACPSWPARYTTGMMGDRYTTGMMNCPPIIPVNSTRSHRSPKCCPPIIPVATVS